MAENPTYAPVAQVAWNVAVQGDGTGAGTETYYPDGKVTAKPTDDNERVSNGTGLVSLYRQERTLTMSGGVLRGDLPADIEGTGWTWEFRATLTYTDVAGNKRTISVGPFYGESKIGETLDLAEAAKGKLSAGTWTTQGPAGVGVSKVTLLSDNSLSFALTDGTTQTTQPIAVTGTTTNTQTVTDASTATSGIDSTTMTGV